MKSFSIIFILSFALVFAAQINAQKNSKPHTGSAILSGTVYDANGAVIPKAKIIFQNNINDTFTTESNDEGIYSINLPFNLFDLNSSKDNFQILRYKIIVDLEDKGFRKEVFNFNFVSSNKGKMIFDIALDSLDPEPCGYGGLCDFPTDSVEIKTPEIKISDKVLQKPLENMPKEQNNKRKN